jgi:hypothetical protein
MEFPMTMISTTSLYPSFGAKAKAALAVLGQALVAIGEAQSRRDQILNLQALSDAQLAAHGLTRDGIVAYVFRDRMGL